MADAARDLKGVMFVIHMGTPLNLFVTFRLPTPGGAAELFSRFSIRRTATPIEVFAKFELQLINDLFADFTVRQPGTADLFSKFIVSQDLEENLFAELVVRHPDTATLFAKFLPRAELTEDLKATLDVGQNSADLKTLSLISGFGNVITEATSRELTQGYILGTRFTMGPNMAVGSKMVFWYSPDGVINYARGAIYTVSGNRPGTLIEETAMSGALSGEGWKELSFVDKPILEAGTDYFLLIWLNQAPGAEVRYTIPDSTLRGFTKSMGAGAVGSFTSQDPMAGGAERTYRFSVYATYDLATNGTADVFAKFEVWQNSGDLKAVLLLRQLTGDLKATFTLPETEDLFAKFIVAQDSKDLFAYFEAQVSQNLFAKFTVNHDFYADLFCVLELYRPYSNLFARVYVVNKDTQELYSKFTVYNGGSEQLYAKALIAQPISKDLRAQFTVRHGATRELFAEFELQIVQNLKATFYISTDPNMPSYYPIINSEIRDWMNYVQVAGKGFIGFPEFEDDPVDYRVPPNSLKISADRVQKGYKEFIFGWLYEGVDLRYWQPTPCVDGLEFNRLVAERWTGFVSETVDYTDLEKETYIRRQYLTDYGAGGLYYINDNYYLENVIKVGSYSGLLPGDTSYQRVHENKEAPLVWDLSRLSALDITRMGWARIEVYRYASGNLIGGELRTQRIPDCEDIDVRGPGLYGGCYTANHTSTGIGPSGVWTVDGTATYHYMGGSNMSFYNGPVLPPYELGNKSFSTTPYGYGGSVADNEWDMADLTELMLGWLNGTYNNHGMWLKMGPFGYEDFRQYTDQISYYSSRAASAYNAYKPKLRVMLNQENPKWNYSDPLHWDVNTDDPYSGTAALRLRDWSKQIHYSAGSEHSTERPSMTLKDETPAEGYIETAFRLNTAELTDLDDDDYWAGKVYTLVIDNVPLRNYFNVYFRWQDANNHYRVEFNKQGTSCYIIRVVGGQATVLNSFSGYFNPENWYKIRVAFALTSNGDLKICCYKLDEFNNRWAFLAGAVETGDPYLSDGGEVRFETMDADLDETDVWEVQ